MRTTIAALSLLLRCILPGEAYAIDHKNLDENRPLRLEDAYPIADGEITIEAGGGLRLGQRSPNRGVFPIEILYGAYPNLQLSLGSTLLTDPRSVTEPPASGDLRLSALYNVNQETLTLPAFAGKVGLTIPTGIGSTAIGVGLKGIVTKSIERLSLHLNVGYEFLSGTKPTDRDGRYDLIFGMSYPIGAPKFTRATLVWDVFTAQSERRGQDNITGTEVGLRYQLTPRIVWDAGVGTEFAGPANRSPFFLTTGFSFGF